LPNICFSIIAVLSFVFFATAQTTLGSGTYRNMFDDLFLGSPLLEFRADLLDNNKPSLMKDTLDVNFESRNVTFSRTDKLTGMSLWEFHYDEMEDYLRDMEKYVLYSLWREIVREKGRVTRAENKASKPALSFAVPANLPRWATRIMGQEPPKLSITGTQKLYLGGQRTGTGTKDNPEYSEITPDFKPTSNFNIKGSVGRLLHLEINLKGDVSEDDFFQQAKDQLSQVKIHYREETPGELEDDIIQEVEIGRTSFQMPGQGLAGYSSGSNENLFGIKVRSKWGPLELTTIASIENVEAQHKTIDRNKSKTTDSTTELNYIRNQFFYLDEIYRNGATEPNIATDSIQIYKRIPGFESNPNTRYAFINGDETQVFNFTLLENGKDYVIHRNRRFRSGVIQFTSRLSDDDVIGIISTHQNLPKGDPTLRPITVRDTTHTTALTNLWTLKNSTSRIDDPIYNLMLRNVYYVGTGDPTDFDLKIDRRTSDGQIYGENNGRAFTDILGLSDKGILYKTNSDIFDLENGYMYIPHFNVGENDAANGNWAFTNPALGNTMGESNTNPDIYDDAKSQTHTAKFRISTESRKISDRFHLDFGVVEGSERLWIGADTLVRNIDYNIEYGYGEVFLISEKAKGASSIEVNYQKESLFLLDKKTFIGINGKLNLPGIGQNSFWSTTVMWQLMDAKKMTPRVGTEPYNRFLFDSNLRLDFAPLWMTSAINYIPLIEREAQSNASFDFEVAHSSTKNSAKSGGEAFIDNFSSSARTYTLGLSQFNWQKAAPDKGMLENFNQNPPVWHQYWYQTAEGDSRSYRREIYKPEQTSYGAQTYNDRMTTFRLVAQPLPENENLRTNASGVKPYAGISYGFSSSSMDRSEDRYFEFWIKKRTAKGILTIDLGEVSEDISIAGERPSGNLTNNAEAVSTTITPELDLGLDMLSDINEYYVYPNLARNDFDTLNYNDPRLGNWRLDPSKDNWKLYNSDSLQNRIHTNGTQGNSRVDRKDIDGDGMMTTESSSSYFRYTIDLNNIENSPFHDKSQIANEVLTGAVASRNRDTSWYHIRIPIVFIPDTIAEPKNSSQKIFDDKSNGKPDWRTIRHVRMLWTGMENATIAGHADSLEFEGMQFVGNQWREQIYVEGARTRLNVNISDSTSSYDSDSSTMGSVVASILDSRTTPGYTTPRLKRLDSINGEQSVDYSLRLEYNKTPRKKEVLVSRRFDASQAMNLSNYRAIKFWAADSLEKINAKDSVWLVLRFGNDSLTYYEFKTRKLNGPRSGGGSWNGEGFTINLEDLTKLKVAWFNKHSERNGFIDTAIAINGNGENGDSLKIYSQTRISPTLSNVMWVAFGIQNSSTSEYNGDIRINGFRATGITDYSGWALRASAKLNWSDFIENAADFKYTDAGFRSMSDEVFKENAAQLNSSASSSIKLDKFFPDRFGLQIPLGGQINATLQRPEMRPNSDIKLQNSRDASDDLRDMGGDFSRILTNSNDKGEITPSEEYEKRELNRSAYIGYHKNKTSEKVAPRLIADRIGIDYRMSFSDLLARMGEIPEVEKKWVNREDFGVYHAEINKSQQHNMKLDYNFSPSAKALQTLSWQPFKDNKSASMPRRIKTMSLNLLPERVVFDVADANYSKRENYSSIQDAIDTTGEYFANKKPVEGVGMSHRLNITYKPINPFLSVNYNMGIDRNFDRFIRDWGQSGVDNFTKKAVLNLDDEYGSYNVLFGEQRRNQNITLSFTPEITRWLTFSSNSSGGYSQNMEQRTSSLPEEDTTYMNTSVNSSFDFNTQFNIRRLFEDVSKGIKNNEKFAEGLSNVAKGFEKVGFENLTFTYRTSMDLRNRFLDMEYLNYGLESSNANLLLYSFGLYDRSFKDFVTGNMDDANSFGGAQNRNNWWENREGSPKNSEDARNTSQNISVSTSLKIPQPIDISINTISLGWRRNYAITQETNKLDTTVAFPDIRIGMSSSALEQLEVVKQNFSIFRLDWGYNYSKENRKTGTLDSAGIPDSIRQDQKIAWGFSPLIKTTLRLKKLGIDLSYSLDLKFDSTAVYNSSFTENRIWRDTLTHSTLKKVLTNDWTASYGVEGKRGRTIKLFRDQVVEIKGDIIYSLGIGHSKTYYVDPNLKEHTGEEGNYDETSIRVYPKVEYKLTKNIDAVLFYDLIQSITGKEQSFSHNGRMAMEITISF